jgi:hypothetical protein
MNLRFLSHGTGGVRLDRRLDHAKCAVEVLRQRIGHHVVGDRGLLVDPWATPRTKSPA